MDTLRSLEGQVRGGKLTPTLVSFLYVCYRRFAMQKPKVLAHTRRVEVVVDRNKTGTREKKWDRTGNQGVWTRRKSNYTK